MNNPKTNDQCEILRFNLSRSILLVLYERKFEILERQYTSTKLGGRRLMLTWQTICEEGLF